jgi:hypothetical protein
MASSLKVLKKKNICYVFFFVITLLAGCLRVLPKPSLTREEKTELEPLFRYLLF